MGVHTYNYHRHATRIFHVCQTARTLHAERHNPFLIRHSSTWLDRVSDTSHKVQTYISKTDDPFLNLSVEHFLLENSPPDSAILFLYVNRPCVVIGRNQNPWLEVNLNILKACEGRIQTEPPGLGVVDLVRRRSGGGTVFHDEGNVNWSVICPPAIFTRDKHAEMVVRALRRNGVERARVNTRHDIVLDQGSRRHNVAAEDLHRTAFTVDDLGADNRVPIKVSGSAYKLTKRRALHHGTCLLASPNLNIIPQYLRSPAKPYIKAKGVESVSSPVGNIGLDVETFKSDVIDEFRDLYTPEDHGKSDKHVNVGEDALENPAIRDLWREMKTIEWTFGQTPQFEFSTHPTERDERERPPLPSPLSASTRVFLEAKQGKILRFDTFLSSDILAEEQPTNPYFEGRKLHDQDWTWEEALVQTSKLDRNMNKSLATWLESMLPLEMLKDSS